jgi:hypothetical protein
MSWVTYCGMALKRSISTHYDALMRSSSLTCGETDDIGARIIKVERCWTFDRSLKDDTPNSVK